MCSHYYCLVHKQITGIDHKCELDWIGLASPHWNCTVEQLAFMGLILSIIPPKWQSPNDSVKSKTDREWAKQFEQSICFVVLYITALKLPFKSQSDRQRKFINPFVLLGWLVRTDSTCFLENPVNNPLRLSIKCKFNILFLHSLRPLLYRQFPPSMMTTE